jgi:hypothetical protein
VTRSLAAPTKQQLRLIVQKGDPAASGSILAGSETFNVQ